MHQATETDILDLITTPHAPHYSSNIETDSHRKQCPRLPVLSSVVFLCGGRAPSWREEHGSPLQEVAGQHEQGRDQDHHAHDRDPVLCGKAELLLLKHGVNAWHAQTVIK